MKDKEKFFEELEAKIKAFTEAHKDEDSEEIINVCRGNWWPEEPVSEDLEKAANGYAWADNYIAVNKNTCNREEYPSIDSRMIPIGDRIKIAFISGAKWRERQMIDKACEWLENLYAPDGSIIPEHIRILDDFRKAMKAEK